MSSSKREFTEVEIKRLATCHPWLQDLVRRVNKIIPIFVVCGIRNEAEQTKAFNSKASRVQYPNSRHNRSLLLGRDDVSDAVDVAPVVNGKVNWDNTSQYFYMCGVIKGVAEMMSIEIRQGCDFNMNLLVTDDNFRDLPHLELSLVKK